MTNESLKPNYIKIYTDLIAMKFPEKKDTCRVFLQKEFLTELDVIKLENIIFGKSVCKNNNNKKHRSYDKSTIQKILDFQKAKNLNNLQLAKHYGLSRNTVAKWRKMFL